LIISEAEATPSRITGHDLLYCGLPGGWDITDSAPRLEVSGKSFAIDRQTFKGPHDALFLVTRHPTESARVAALFSPLSASAAADCAPKITHYGKYSFLAFSAGENRGKGISTVASGVGDILFDSGSE
jgi:hypothetical protein